MLEILEKVGMAYGSAVIFGPPPPGLPARRVEGLKTVEAYLVSPDDLVDYIGLDAILEATSSLSQRAAATLVKLAPIRQLGYWAKLPPELKAGWFAQIADRLGSPRALAIISLAAGVNQREAADDVSRALSDLARLDGVLAEVARRAAASPGVLYSADLHPGEPLPLYLAERWVRPAAGTLSWRILCVLAERIGIEGVDLRRVKAYMVSGGSLRVTWRRPAGATEREEYALPADPAPLDA